MLAKRDTSAVQGHHGTLSGEEAQVTGHLFGVGCIVDVFMLFLESRDVLKLYMQLVTLKGNILDRPHIPHFLFLFQVQQLLHDRRY